MIAHISATQLRDRLADASAKPPLLLDVRRADEVAFAPFKGALHIPMNEIPARMGELDPATPIVAICHSGVRSMQVARFLDAQGFAELFNLTGGIDAWSVEVDPSVPRY